MGLHMANLVCQWEVLYAACAVTCHMAKMAKGRGTETSSSSSSSSSSKRSKSSSVSSMPQFYKSVADLLKHLNASGRNSSALPVSCFFNYEDVTPGSAGYTRASGLYYSTLLEHLETDLKCKATVCNGKHRGAAGSDDLVGTGWHGLPRVTQIDQNFTTPSQIAEQHNAQETREDHTGNAQWDVEADKIFTGASTYMRCKKDGNEHLGAFLFDVLDVATKHKTGSSCDMLVQNATVGGHNNPDKANVSSLFAAVPLDDKAADEAAAISTRQYGDDLFLYVHSVAWHCLFLQAKHQRALAITAPRLTHQRATHSPASNALILMSDSDSVPEVAQTKGKRNKRKADQLSGKKDVVESKTRKKQAEISYMEAESEEETQEGNESDDVTDVVEGEEEDGHVSPEMAMWHKAYTLANARLKGWGAGDMMGAFGEEKDNDADQADPQVQGPDLLTVDASVLGEPSTGHKRWASLKAFVEHVHGKVIGCPPLLLYRLSWTKFLHVMWLWKPAKSSSSETRTISQPWVHGHNPLNDTRQDEALYAVLVYPSDESRKAFVSRLGLKATKGKDHSFSGHNTARYVPPHVEQVVDVVLSLGTFQVPKLTVWCLVESNVPMIAMGFANEGHKVVVAVSQKNEYVAMFRDMLSMSAALNVNTEYGGKFWANYTPQQRLSTLISFGLAMDKEQLGEAFFLGGQTPREACDDEPEDQPLVTQREDRNDVDARLKVRVSDALEQKLEDATNLLQQYDIGGVDRHGVEINNGLHTTAAISTDEQLATLPFHFMSRDRFVPEDPSKEKRCVCVFGHGLFGVLMHSPQTPFSGTQSSCKLVRGSIA